jgi:hypothetical protein
MKSNRRSCSDLIITKISSGQIYNFCLEVDMRTFSAAVAAASPIRRLFVAAVSALVVLISLSPASAGTGNLPANATERTWGEGWDCRQGFLEARGSCTKIRVPYNAFLNDRGYGKGWACERGFIDAGGHCEKVVVPENAYLTDLGTDWSCRRGYAKTDEQCVPLRVPEHGHVDASGNDWRCPAPYHRIRDACVRS